MYLLRMCTMLVAIQCLIHFGGCIETEPMVPESRPVAGVWEPDWTGGMESVAFNALEARVIGNRELWVTTWTAVHNSADIPDVDFDRYVVFIDSCDMNDPNRRTVSFHAEANTLFVGVLTTAMGFNRSSSVKLDFYVVRRDGLTHYYKPGDRSRRKWPIK